MNLVISPNINIIKSQSLLSKLVEHMNTILYEHEIIIYCMTHKNETIMLITHILDGEKHAKHACPVKIDYFLDERNVLTITLSTVG